MYMRDIQSNHWRYAQYRTSVTARVRFDSSESMLPPFCLPLTRKAKKKKKKSEALAFNIIFYIQIIRKAHPIYSNIQVYNPSLIYLLKEKKIVLHNLAHRKGIYEWI